jgi:hypothetical protein
MRILMFLLLVASAVLTVVAVSYLSHAGDMEWTQAHIEASASPPHSAEERAAALAYEAEMNSYEMVGIWFGVLAGTAGIAALVIWLLDRGVAPLTPTFTRK